MKSRLEPSRSASPRSISSRPTSSNRSRFMRHVDASQKMSRSRDDSNIEYSNVARANDTRDYELFDPIDYVVADNVLDFRTAREDRMRARREEELRLEQMDAEERAFLEAEAHLLQTQEETRARLDARRAIRLRRQEERQRKYEAKMAKCPACHWGLLVATVLLALLSIPIVYSASQTLALDHHDNADFFLLRQIGFVAAGLGWFLLVSRMNAKQMRAAVWGMYFVALIGLILIDFTPLGTDLGSGTKRWLKIMPGLPPQQVSELAKIALIGVLADFWSRAAKASQSSMWPWAIAAMISLPMIVLVFAQPHLSATLLLLTLPFVVAAHADVPRKHFGRILVPLAVAGVLVVGLCKMHAMPGIKPYQQDRIANHFGGGGEKASREGNYQVEQSQRALMNGGVLGVGPGESLFKQGHLPAPHTDFILAVIGEEWGLVGLLLLLGTYAAMIFFCLHVGHCAETSFEALLCSGVGTLLAIQVLGNAFVVTGIMPVTGIPLPLLSYGGSGLVCALTGIGMVLGISRQLGRSCEEKTARVLSKPHVETSRSRTAPATATRRANATA